MQPLKRSNNAVRGMHHFRVLPVKRHGQIAIENFFKSSTLIEELWQPNICWIIIKSLLVSVTANKPTISSSWIKPKCYDPADAQKRKSKWDSAVPVTLAQPALLTTTATLPGVVSVTTTASGTKTTVISAVGTILKKAKQWHGKKVLKISLPDW